jgi:mono/diheme cytochrome c family protein
MYISIANPAPFPGTKEFPWATSRPGPNKDTNTLVKLDAASGEVQWKQQVLPHDLYDWDLHLPPVLADTDDGQQLVVTGGKMGIVYAMDRESGEIQWQTPVGRHSGNDEDNANVAANGREAAPETPFELYPGFLGGVETQMAISEGVVFAPIVNLSVTIKNGFESQLNLDTGTGEMVALNLATGEQLWSHEFETPVYGAATLANDLLFTTTFDGTLWALDPTSGDEVWSTKMPAGTNATVAIAGDTIVTAASYPQSADEQASIIAYRLGATGEAEGGATTGEEGATTGEEGATTGEEGETTGEPAPPTDTEAAEEAAADGEQIFATNCASCHALAAANASGSVGPNLDQSQADQEAIEQKVINGGGGMPAFGGRLTDAEIQAVAQYVADNRDPNAEGGGGGGSP